MLHIVHSNRLDALADAMLDRWPGARPPGALPVADLVVVPSRGVERWLTWRIADRNGVCANVNFRFAAKFLWETFARALPGVPENSPFDSDVTALRLFSYLARLPAAPELAPLRAYLAGNDDLRRFELATRISKQFSDYMVYRPDWLDRWARGRAVEEVAPAATEAWQRHLWAWLLGSVGAENLQHPKDAFFEALVRRAEGARGILPERVRVFGLPSVPPLYLDILTNLARFVDVEWYALNPCRQFWADIVAERTRVKALLKGDPSAPLVDVGHPLLASWGSQARSQHALLADRSGGEGTEDDERFAAPEGPSLLHRLQASIVDLAPPEPGSVVRDPADRSIRVHACHSLTRQVEVLHDQLLALFDAMPDLEPSDVAVFAPDLEALAPVVEAVFGSAPQGRDIRYAVTGRAAADGPILRAAQFLLGLANSRFEAAAVLGFLEIPAVARRFRLDVNDLDTIRKWLAEAGARWGLDAAHRERLGVPAESRHTWQETLYRLLVGYALPSGHQALYRGVLPYPEIEGSSAATLGRLVAALSELARAAAAFSQKHRLQDWAKLLQQHIKALLEPLPDDARDMDRLHTAVSQIGRDARAAEAHDLVGSDVVAALLESRLDASAPGAVPSGVVTFASIGQLRGLPFRVIALLGLDAEAFPRNPSRVEFDLTKSQRRHGDRSMRDDDRGAFLDALMAARDVLYLSFTGRSILDNAKLPPSVLVAELSDHLSRIVAGGVGKWLVTEHALQPFNARYFTPGQELSYAADLLGVARALDEPLQYRGTARPLFSKDPLALPEGEGRQVDLGALISFFMHPIRHLIRRRLGIRLDVAEEELSPDEPFAFAGLDTWSLSQRLLQLRLDGRSFDDGLALLQVDPRVPHGAWGRQLLEPIAADVEGFVPRVLAERGAPPIDPWSFELDVGAFTLSGTLSGVGPDGLFIANLRKEGVKDLLGAWIQHLVLCALRPEGASCVTRVVTNGGGLQFGAVDDPRAALGVLLDYHWRGLQAPLSFFPRSSYAYLTEKDEARRMNAALKCWRGGRDRDRDVAGERADVSYRLCFGGVLDVLPDDFVAVSEAILLAPLAARRDLESRVPAGSAP